MKMKSGLEPRGKLRSDSKIESMKSATVFVGESGLAPGRIRKSRIPSRDLPAADIAEGNTTESPSPQARAPSCCDHELALTRTSERRCVKTKPFARRSGYCMSGANPVKILRRCRVDESLGMPLVAILEMIPGRIWA